MGCDVTACLRMVNGDVCKNKREKRKVEEMTPSSQSLRTILPKYVTIGT